MNGEDRAQSQRSAYSIEVIDQRVGSLERTQQMILDRIDLQSSKFEGQMTQLKDAFSASRTPQWTVVSSFLGVTVIIIGALWGTGINPIRSDIASLIQITARNTDSISTLQQAKVSENDYANDIILDQSRRELDYARVESEVEKLEQRLEKISDSLVPRGEHEQHWSNLEDATVANRELFLRADENLQRQLDEIAADFDNIYSARDVITEMQGRMNQLDETILQLLRELPAQGASE
jgi:polyhydroxyalkanoate synthesis regulator phasin